MPASHEPFDPNRRRFLVTVGLAGITSLSAPALALTQTGPRPRGAPPKRGPAPPPASEIPPEIAREARALAAIVGRRYGQHLTAEQLEGVTKEIENRLQGGKRLREAKLANGDEPDFTFRA